MPSTKSIHSYLLNDILNSIRHMFWWVVRWCRSSHRMTAGVWWVVRWCRPSHRTTAVFVRLICANNTYIHVNFISYFKSILFPHREVSFHVITWNRVAWRETISRHFTFRSITISQPVTDLYHFYLILVVDCWTHPFTTPNITHA